jgi:hypothetical protein
VSDVGCVCVTFDTEWFPSQRRIAMFSRNLNLNTGSLPFEDIDQIDLTGPF